MIAEVLALARADRRAALDEGTERALRGAQRDAGVLGEAARRPRRSVTEQERDARSFVVRRRQQHDDLSLRIEHVAVGRRDGLRAKPLHDFSEPADLDAEPCTMGRVHPPRGECVRRELVSRHRSRPRPSEQQQELEERGTAHEWDRDAPADREAPACVDEEMLAAREVLDGEEIGATERASSQHARDRMRELLLQRDERAGEQLIGSSLQGAPCAREGGPRIRGRDGSDGDLRLSEPGERIQIRRELGREDLLDDAPCLVEATEQDLGARENETHHHRIARVAEPGQLLRGCSGGLRCRSRVARRQRDLDERGAGAGARPRVARERNGAFESELGEIEISHLRVRDPAERETERSLDSPDQSERLQRLAQRECATCIEQGRRYRWHLPRIDRSRRLVTSHVRRLRRLGRHEVRAPGMLLPR